MYEKSGRFAGTPYFPIKGDGNCLFYSLSYGLFGNVNEHMRLREEAIPLVRAGWESKNYQYQADGQTLDAYIAYVEKVNNWGSSIEAQALGELYGRRVVFARYDTGVVTLDVGPESDERPIFLRYGGRHFDVYLEKPKNLELFRGVVRGVVDLVSSESEFESESDVEVAHSESGSESIPELPDSDFTSPKVETEGLPVGISLVASGTTHNVDPIFCFKNGGKQSVTICAVALASHFLNRDWNQTIIDQCVHTGDYLYTQLQIPEGDTAAPSQLPGYIVVNNPLVRVDVTENSHVTTFMYASGNQTPEHFLQSKLLSILDTSPPNCGFLFGSARGFVAFVECDDGFLVFDPQPVSEIGVLDQEYAENNTSRVFLCETVSALAHMLLLPQTKDQSIPKPFTVVRLRFRSSLAEQRLQQERERADIETPLAPRGPGTRKRTAKAAQLGAESDSDPGKGQSPRRRRQPARSPVNTRSRASRKPCPVLSSDSDAEEPVAPKALSASDSEDESALSDRLKGLSGSSGATTAPAARGRPRGRPKKVKRGRKAIYTPAQRAEAKRESDRRYNEKNRKKRREANLEANRRYTENNPEVHRDSQQRYAVNNPELRKEQNQRYRAANPHRDKTRHLSTDMQKLIQKHGPMAFWSGDLLDNIQPHRLKKPNLLAQDIFKCNDCGAPLFEEEPHSGLWCCGKGAYNVLDLPPLNADFYDSPEFLNRARAYNDLMAMCALNISGGYRHPAGLSFLKIEGRMHHRIFSLNHRGQATNFKGKETQYVNHCRLYIDDGAERAALAEGRGLKRVIVDAARSHLLANNPFIHHFKVLSEEPCEDARLDFQVTNRATHGPVLGDNNPGLEVHAVVSSGDAPDGAPRSLTVWKRADRYPTKISVFNPLLEPFQYPLLYPHGTVGWSFDRKDKNGKKLSQLNYTRCLLLSEPRFTNLGRLSQAWMVEAQARIEEERLQYIARCQNKNNPNGPRVATVDELQASVQPPCQVLNDINNDELENIAGDETIQGEGGARAGKIYLPSSFTGGPRYMKKKYMDAMGLVCRKGGPTYFLTFTACGGWDELKQSTRHGSRCDPATCCRIFHIKLNELLRDIRSGALFGPHAYLVWVIEMQMRGLPHAHMAIRVEDGGPVQGRDIDQVVRADIPSPEEAGGRLRALVLKHMIHGPCGPEGRTNLPCWDEKQLKCNKFFPKPHCETTHVDDRGFVVYKRDYGSKADRYYRNKKSEIHEGWVIPYNAALLLKYEAHINLEIASTRKVIKYLFKYITKGASHKNMRVLPLHDQLDEVEEYAAKRMLGASDACWRILGFQTTVSEPTVSMLPVHLEGQQSVIYRPGEEADAISRGSPLTLYMERPQDPIFDNVTYQAFYENYIVHTRRPNRAPGKLIYAHPDGRHYITPRERGQCVTRIFWVAPNRGELYYLRLLLTTTPCRGFADLRSKGGPDCETFQEAARRLGFIDNQQEYEEALLEASHFMVGPSLRNFFVVLANIGAPARILWERFKDKLCEDLLERHAEPEIAYKHALIHIDRCLRRNGSCLAAHGLPLVEDDSTELGRQFLMYGEESQRKIYEEWLPRLTAEQRAVLDHVKHLIHDDLPADEPRALFLDGPGGYGKTALLKTITAYIRSQNKIALCCATSGIAALNLEGGSTAHSLFRISIDLTQDVWNITNGTQRAELIKSASLIIFDEAPMAHKHVFEVLNRSLQDLMGNDLFMGGIPFLASGDFRQIPAIAEKAKTPADTVAVSLKSSCLWEKFRVFKLTIPQRTSGSDEYSEYLLKVGNGTLPERKFGEGKEAVNLIPLTPVAHKTDLEDFVNKIYPEDILCEPDKAAERAILSTHNVNVHSINGKILASLPNRVHELVSFDSLHQDGDDGFYVDEETLHTAKGKGVPEHILNLKIGAVCLITRNLNVDQGLVNGTKCIVEAISPRLVRVRLPGTNTSYGIPRIIFTFSINERIPEMKMNRRQFPLQLAYAMTFHKSQGQTIKMVGLDLRTDCFTHGQLYVGLSRVRSPNDIIALVPGDRVVDGVAYTKNVIYPALLEQNG